MQQPAGRIGLFLGAALLCALFNPTSGQCFGGAGAALDVINALRLAHGGAPLTSSPALTTTAQTRAAAVAAQQTSCALSASGTATVGENVAVLGGLPGVPIPCASLAGFWAQGETLYQYTTTPYTSNAAQLPTLLPWLNMLWATTTSVGCATTSTQSGCSILVCVFGAPNVQNTDAAFSANIKPLASGIPTIPTPAPGPAPAGSVTGCANPTGVLTAANALRTQYGPVSALTWDTSLVSQAQTRATALAGSIQTCDASAWATTVTPGESLWAYSLGTAEPAPQCSEAVQDWSSYSSDYPWASATPYTDMQSTTSYTDIAPFTQLVWKATTAVGCASALGLATIEPPGCVIVVCRFNPPGNTPATDAAFKANVLPLSGSTLPSSPSLSPPGRQPPLPGLNGTNSTGCTDGSTLLNFVNFNRALRYASPLSWNASLATQAQTRAGVIRDQVAASNQCSVADNITLPLGEAVFVYPTILGSCEVAVANWLSQETYYNYSSPTPWTTNSPNFFKWRFFTQMVWQNTTAVGCGTANANATSDIFGPGSCQVLLCKYDAPGNTPQTDAAFADNVVPYVDPGSLNYTVANSSSCAGMEAVPGAINLFRLAHATRPLAWNQSFANVSRTRAQQVIAASPDCNLATSNITIGPGESVYMDKWSDLSAFGISPPCILGPGTWIDQEDNYNYTNPNFNTSQTWFSFTQMMWLNSKSVGCEAAIANLTSSTPVTGIPLPGQSMQCLAIVCTYDPPGNTPLLADVFIKNVRPEAFNSNDTTLPVPKTRRRLLRRNA